MANTYYDSQLTAAEIEEILEAINGILTPANNGKVLAISNGKFEARSVQWGGGAPVIETLSVTENGTYTAPTGIDGYSPITVNVSGGGGGFVVDEYSRFLDGVFDTESAILTGNTIEVAFYANSYVSDGHIVGQSYSQSGYDYHLTTYSNRWYVGGTSEANFAADSDCPLYGADIVYRAKTGEVSMNGVVKTTSLTMPNQPSYTYKLNTRGGTVSTSGVYKYKYVKVYDSNNDLICNWEFGHVQVGTSIIYIAHEKVRNIYKSYDGNAVFIQPLRVTQNGTYNPPSGVDGYAPIVVNVSGSGDPDAPYFDLKNYLQSSGSQYINTGYIAKENSHFICVANISGGDSYASIFGSRNAGGETYSTNPICVFAKYSNAFRIAPQFESTAAYAENGRLNYVDTKIVHRLKYDYYLAHLEGNNDVIGFYINSITGHLPTNSIYLCTLSQGGSPLSGTCNCVGKFYAFDVYEDNTLVMSLRPALDGSNVACMYDSVSQTYLYNSGSGSFTYGTDS